MIEATSSPGLNLLSSKGHFVALLDVVRAARVGGQAVRSHECRLAIDEADVGVLAGPRSPLRPALGAVFASYHACRRCTGRAPPHGPSAPPFMPHVQQLTRLIGVLVSVGACSCPFSWQAMAHPPCRIAWRSPRSSARAWPTCPRSTCCRRRPCRTGRPTFFKSRPPVSGMEGDARNWSDPCTGSACRACRTCIMAFSVTFVSPLIAGLGAEVGAAGQVCRQRARFAHTDRLRQRPCRAQCWVYMATKVSLGLPPFLSVTELQPRTVSGQRCTGGCENKRLLHEDGPRTDSALVQAIPPAGAAILRSIKFGQPFTGGNPLLRSDGWKLRRPRVCCWPIPGGIDWLQLDSLVTLQGRCAPSASAHKTLQS